MDLTVTRFQEIYKSRALRFGTSVQPASLSDRLNNINQQRRSSRNIVMMSKRKINEETLTPITSPAGIGKKMKPAKVIVEDKTDHRLEMLRNWQEEKRKRLKQQKITKRPLFKVHHVSVSSQLDLSKVYGEIKGKPVPISSKKKNSGQEQRPLVPTSTYKFKPPANIKPINMKVASTGGTSSGSKNLPKMKPELLPTTRVTRSQKLAVFPPLLQLPGHTRKRLNFLPVEPKKSSPRKKAVALKVTSKMAAKQQDVEPSTSSNVRGSRARKNTKTSERNLAIPLDNRKTDAVPDSTDDDEVFLAKDVSLQKNKRSGKSQRTKLENFSSASSSLSSEYPITSDVNTTISESTEGSTTSSLQPVTPLNKCSGSSVYVSPFVTVSRGKDNARKEFHRRSVRGGSDCEKTTSPKAAATYFNKLLKNQTDRLRMLCHEWDIYKDEQKPAEEVCDMIDVAIGQTNLLLTKKFQQFKGLVMSCETGNSEKPVTCLDLHGFWDMVTIQIDNLDKRFENLQKLKENGWEEVLPTTKPKANKPKKKNVKKSTASSSSLRAAIQEARRKKTAEAQPPTHEELVLPSKFPSWSESTKTRRSRRSSLRRSTLTSETKRSIGSPGLTMMKVTQAAKSAEKSKLATPNNDQSRSSPKSILKSQKSKSVRRKSKVVLFKDDESTEDQENNKNSSNMMYFTPPETPKRRSMRLAKH